MTDTDIGPGRAALLRLLGEYDGGVLVTLKRDGRPQLSNVNHAYYPDEGVIRVSVTEGGRRPATCGGTRGRATT